MADFKLRMKKYVDQVLEWPSLGKHILAQDNDKTVLVYQAFKKPIADWAVKNGKFGGPDYSLTRMTWIKTNFLWMMHRSNWAGSPNQEAILAIHITREGFKEILSRAFTGQKQKEAGLEEVEVRLQWDPDHGPTGEKQARRAIQLGLRGAALTQFNEEWIVSIQDVTAMVEEQRENREGEALEELLTPEEHVFDVESAGIAKQIQLDSVEKKIIFCFGGSFNPIHRNHVDVMVKAKEWLEENTNFQVVEGILVASSEEFVQRKFKKSNEKVIQGEHRIKLCQLAVQEQNWLKVHPRLCGSAYAIGKEIRESGMYIGMIKGGDKGGTSNNWRKLKENHDPLRVDVIIGRGDDIFDLQKQLKDDLEKGWVKNKKFYIVPESVGDLSSTMARKILDQAGGNFDDMRDQLEVFMNKEGVDYIVDNFDNLYIQ